MTEAFVTTRDTMVYPDMSAGMDETSHVLGGELHSKGLNARYVLPISHPGLGLESEATDLSK